jgi:predicted AlkP superfamily pyrophosphatase or phosphodiesterase
MKKIFLFSSLLLVSLFYLMGSVYAHDTKQANHIVLVVLEGIDPETIKSGSMPTLAQFAQEGAVKWEATSVSPHLTVPAMASLLTGLPINKHKITPEWEDYNFARSFLRSPTVFDYMDLAGGNDSAVFFMDERLYQLSRPEIYVDSQMCGMAKPNCTPKTISLYIQDYLKKVTSEGGHGFRLIGVPNLLLVHMPAASRSGQKRGWNSDAYRQAVLEIDNAIKDIVKSYQEFEVLDETMFIVTGLNGIPLSTSSANGSKESSGQEMNQTIPWISWGANVKGNYMISKPVSIIDTGATILYALGLETHTEWDSHAIDEIFQSIPERRTTGNDPSISIH